MEYKPFEIGDLVRYNAVIPSYMPVQIRGIGIVLQVGASDLRIYSMTHNHEVVVRGTSCTLLSPMNEEKI